MDRKKLSELDADLLGQERQAPEPKFMLRSGRKPKVAG
jgi:hypothetical protein